MVKCGIRSFEYRWEPVSRLVRYLPIIGKYSKAAIELIDIIIIIHFRYFQ